jgi:hypothetical protein
MVGRSGARSKEAIEIHRQIGHTLLVTENVCTVTTNTLFSSTLCSLKTNVHALLQHTTVS